MIGRVLLDGYPFVPYRGRAVPAAEARLRGRDLYQELRSRRSVRSFSGEPVPRELIEWAIRCAATAPSGAHRQPWKFVAVADPELKTRIRRAAEQEERRSYEDRMPEEWLKALAPLGTTPDKPYLEIAPWLVVVFAERWGVDAEGGKVKHYYVSESVGIACGLFVAALHRMGLATVTHTPSPMGFLSTLLHRPPNETPYILFPVGYPTEDCLVPELHRKDLDEVAVWHPAR